MKLLRLKLLIFLIIVVLIANLNCDNSPTEPNYSPIVVIKTPLDEDGFLARKPVSFSAVVIDPEDGRLSDSALVWSSSMDGDIGIGEEFQTDQLTQNDHYIILKAKDSNGNIGIDSVNVNIYSNTDPIVSILKPVDSSILIFGVSNLFSCIAKDPEDGFLRYNSIVWKSNIDGFIGTGSSFLTTSLTENNHIITSTATDSDSNIVIDTISITIISPPVVNILSPLNSNVLPYDQMITFSASAIDIEDGILTGNSLVWTSDKDGQLGFGTTLFTASLSENEHLITVTATDSDNNIGSKHNIFRVTISWKKTIENLRPVYASCATSNGDYIIASRGDGNGVDFTDVNLIKCDNSGNILWTKVFNLGYNDIVRSIYQTMDGGFLITGHANKFPISDVNIFLIKTDINGNLIWQKSFDEESSDAFGRSVSETIDGDIIITGMRTIDRQTYFLYLLKTNRDGEVLWSKEYSDGNSRGYSMSVSDSGYTILGSNNQDMYLLQTDLDGNVLWENIYGGSYIESGYSLISTSDNGFILVGSTGPYVHGSSDLYIVKTDINGSLVWEKTFVSRGQGYGYYVVEALDGGYVISGGYMQDSQEHVYIIKIDLSGNLIWDNIYTEFSSAYNSVRGLSIIETIDGGYFITTTSDFVLKTDANGQVYLMK